MPDIGWLEGPVWLMVAVLSLWLIVRSVAWGLQIRAALESDRQPVRPTNGASAEWRGETRQVLKQLRAALHDSTQLDKQTLDVLRQVRDELREHNRGAHERHHLVREIHERLMRGT